MGRVWVSHTVPSASMAHSMSCGEPARRSTASPRATSSCSCSGMRQAEPSPDVVSSRMVPPPGRERIATRLSPRRWSRTAEVVVSTTKWSGLTAPETTASPSPGAASMTA